MTTQRARSAFVRSLTLTLLLFLWAGPAQALPPAGAQPAAPPARNTSRAAWAQSTGIFLGVSCAGAFCWYAWLFPWLLTRTPPRWPLDAWRLSTYATWLTICLGACAFQTRMEPFLARMFNGSDSFQTTMKQYAFFVLLVLAAVLGLVMIWSFRREPAKPATI